MPTIDINLVLLGVLVAWHYSLFCGYISDDHAAVAQRQDIIPDTERVDRGESFWVKRFNDGVVMFYLTRIFWKLGFKDIPFPWHLVSLALHLANTYLFYLFLYPIFGNDVALYASAFWAVNPMLNQNVVWISGRPYTIAVTLSLIALICWDKPYVFLPYYALALITNISIFFVPVISLLIHWDWQSKLYLGLMFLAGLPWLFWKFQHRFIQGLVIDRDNFKLKPRKIHTFARMVFYYISSMFFPVRMGWYHQDGFRYNDKWEKFNYQTFLGYCLIAIFVLYFKLPGWIFILGLLPNANLYATNSFLQDRYLYFCSIGIALMVAPFLAKYPALFYMAMTFYITKSYMYSRSLKDDEALYRENWRNHPKSDYAINNLSYFLIQQRRYDEARVVIERGLNVEDKYGNPIGRLNKMLWYNLGITWAAQGHFNNDEGKFRFIRAIEAMKQALALEPRWGKPAQDINRIVTLLIEKKVLTLEKNESAPHGLTISIPGALNGINIPKQDQNALSTQVSTTPGSNEKDVGKEAKANAQEQGTQVF